MSRGRPTFRPIVAIDGPAGAGKSTVAKHLAQRFGLLNLETGAMYRAFALKALLTGTDPDSEEALMALVGKTSIMLEPKPAGNQVFLDGTDVTTRVRESKVTAMASRISVHPLVRHWMVEQQRLLGASGGVVMEGRDIGTVVFPDADVKIFLDADPEIRGARRFQQNGSGSNGSEASVLQEIRNRDQRDRSRAESPLRPAPEAVVVDSSRLTLDEVLQRVDRLVSELIERSYTGSKTS